MKLKVAIAGATGWVGRPLSLAVAAADDLSLTGAVSRTHAGHVLRDVIGEAKLDVQVTGSVAEALNAPTDVLVGYPKGDGGKANVMAALRRGVDGVIGSSGLTDEDFAEINSAASAKQVGVIAAGNFAITAVLLQRFA